MSSSSYIDWSKTTQSKNYRGSNSFATFMIVGPTCFFLGILFAMFPYDFPLLWSKAPVDPEFYNQLEEHLKFVHQSPPLLARMLNIIVSVVFLAFVLKMWRPGESNFLFDGASMILYLVAVAVYTANTVKGLRTISAGHWHEPENAETREGAVKGEMILGREDSLRVLAASNTILALVLVGVLVLQAGQWYAEQKDAEEIIKDAKREAEAANKSSKKKQ